MADISILDSATHAAPKAYVITGAQEIVLKGVTASFDGTSAPGSFVPVVQVIDPSGHIVGTYTLGTTLLAGATADVSWFPGIGGSNSTGGSSFTRTVQLFCDTPDANGYGFVGLSTQNAGFTNIRRACITFDHAAAIVSTWSGAIQIPADYSSSPSIRQVFVCSNTTPGAAAHIYIGTSVVADGQEEDVAFTLETPVNIVAPSVAGQQFSHTWTLSTAPAPGATLNFQFYRDASNGGDTLTAIPLLLWYAEFVYTPAF